MSDVDAEKSGVDAASAAVTERDMEIIAMIIHEVCGIAKGEQAARTIAAYLNKSRAGK